MNEETTIIHSVNEISLDDYEAILWSDGSVTINHWLAPYRPAGQFDTIKLSAEQTNALQRWLISLECAILVLTLALC